MNERPPHLHPVEGAPETEGGPWHPRRRRKGPSHALDYLHVLRAHVLLAGLAFVVVVGLKAWDAVTEQPVYTARATIQLDTSQAPTSSGGGGYWSAWERGLQAAAEVEVIQSWPVARLAAGDPDAEATATIVEQNAYRPLEAYLRKVDRKPDLARLRVYAATRERGTATWMVRFDASGTRVSVWPSSTDPQTAVTTDGFRPSEPFSDRDLDGRWDAAEPFTDEDSDGRYDTAEAYTDLNRNGRWDPAETWEDRDGSGRWEPAEPFSDPNRNGIRDEGESYTDLNTNGRWDDAEPLLTDLNGNGVWDPAEPLEDLNQNGHQDEAEPFEDRNGNHRWDEAEPFVDVDGDGRFEPGTPLRLGSQEVHLAVLEGDPAGRTFVVTLRSLEEGARWIKAGVQANQVTEYTSILSVGFTADRPELAAAAANAVAEAYGTWKREQRSREVRQRLEYLDGEIGRMDAQLAQLERERDDYVTRTNAVLLGERAKSILEEQGALVRERLEHEARKREIDWRLGELRRELPSDQVLLMLGGDSVDAKTSVLATRITELETQIKLLLDLQKETEGGTRVTEMRAEIAQLQPQLDDRVRALVLREVKGLEAEEKQLDRRLEEIRLELARQDELLQDLPQLEREVVRRNRPIEVQAEMYENLVRTKQEAEIARESIASDVVVLDPARPPSTRTSPNLTRTIVLALVLGLLAAIAAAFLAEYLVRSVRSPQELEEGLGLPVYASIPDFRSVRARERRGLKRGESLVARAAPSSVIAESYRMLRANIRFTNPEQPLQAIAITSALEEEGKTTTNLNLAIVAAQAGTKTIVVDADLRRSSVHENFGLPQAPGLVEVLRGELPWREVLRPSGVEHLDILTAGRTPSNPSALLDSEAFSRLLEELRSEYALVLFDLPPVLAVADAAAFFRQLDGILLLNRYRRCPIEVVDGAREQIERVGGNLIGAILNRFDARRSARRGYGYYGYYGYYSRYGGYDRPR